MPYENVILNQDTFADERVAGDLDVSADMHILLDLDKCADLAVVSYRAAIEIDKGEDSDTFTEDHVWSYSAMLWRRKMRLRRWAILLLC